MNGRRTQICKMICKYSREYDKVSPFQKEKGKLIWDLLDHAVKQEVKLYIGLEKPKKVSLDVEDGWMHEGMMADD